MIGRFEPAGEIDPSLQRERHRAPAIVERRADRFARQRMAEARLEQRLGPPGVGEDGRRVGGQHLRIFDAGDPSGRNGEHLRDPGEILEDRDALRLAVSEIDALAGFWAFARLDVRHAGVVHDAPQGHRVGAGGERGERKAERERERSDARKP